MISSLGLRRAGNRHFSRAPAAGLGDATPVGVGGGRRGAHRQRQAQGFDDAGHGARGPHHHAGADRRSEAAADQLDLSNVDDAGAVLPPKPAAIRASPQNFTFMMTHHHRPGRYHNCGKIGAGGGHNLGREGLIAAADQHHRVHGLRTNHFLGVHRHQVAQEHRGGVGKTLADRDGGKHHRQAACEHNTALYALDQVGNIAMAWIEITEGIGYADDRAIERVLGITGSLDEGLAQEQREARVTVAGEPFAQATGGFSCRRIVHPAILYCRYSP